MLTRRPHILKSKECKSASRPVLRSTEVRRVFLSIEHRSPMDGKEQACTIVRSLENFKEALQSHPRLFRLVCTLGSRTLARAVARKIPEDQSASKNLTSAADSYSSGPS